MENILNSVKAYLGIKDNFIYYDHHIISYINSTFTILNQLGVGPKGGFTATEDSIWDDFFKHTPVQHELVKAYIKSRVQLMFDPPSSSFVLTALEKQIKEYEWRLNVLVDPILDMDMSDYLVMPAYYGVSDSHVVIDFSSLVEQISKRIDLSYLYTTNNQFKVFAYKRKYGDLAGIKDQNGFECIYGWNKIIISNDEIDYNVYISEYATTDTNAKYSFVF